MPLVGTGRDEAAGGVIGINGLWNLVGRGTNHPGYLAFNLQQRHRIGPVVPQNLGLEIGSLWPTVIGYSELTFSAVELYWAQFLIKDRIWRREGLKVPTKQPKRGRLWLNDGSCIRLRPKRPNHVWSYDFV